MIYIKSGHILTSHIAATARELQQLESLIAQNQLQVPLDCLEAFRHIGSSQPYQRLIPRDYKYHHHEMLMCACGFLGGCRQMTYETSSQATTENIGPHAASSETKSSAATRIPPELFSVIASWGIVVTRGGTTSEIARRLSGLSMTCRYWNSLYRPLLWRDVMLKSREDLYSFASIIKTPPKGLPSVANFVQDLVVRAIGVPPQPWIHLVPVVLKANIPSHSVKFSSLDITMKSEGLGDQVKDYVSMHLTHDSLPRSLSAFDHRFERLSLSGINFRRPVNFLKFIRSFRYIEDLDCARIRCLNYTKQLQLYKPTRDPPLRRITFPVWPMIGSVNVPLSPMPAWISIVWSSVRRRYDRETEYLLEDDETWLVMRITSFFQGSHRRKHTPSLSLTVQDAVDKTSARLAGFDFHFKIDRNIYEVTFCTTAGDTIHLSAPGPTGFLYKALHVKHVVISPRNRGNRSEVLEKLLDYAQIGLLIAQLPHLEKVVFAFEHTYSEELGRAILEHLSAVRNTGKLIAVRADIDIWSTECRWVEQNPHTLKPTGRSCPHYGVGDQNGPDNIGGLSALWNSTSA